MLNRRTWTWAINVVCSTYVSKMVVSRNWNLSASSFCCRIKTRKTKSKQWSKLTSEKDHRWWCYVLTARFYLSLPIEKNLRFLNYQSDNNYTNQQKLEWIVIFNIVTKSNNFSSRNNASTTVCWPRHSNVYVGKSCQLSSHPHENLMKGDDPESTALQLYNLPQGYNGLQMPVPTRTVCCKTCHSAFPLIRIIMLFTAYASVNLQTFQYHTWVLQNKAV